MVVVSILIIIRRHIGYAVNKVGSCASVEIIFSIVTNQRVSQLSSANIPNLAVGIPVCCDSQIKVSITNSNLVNAKNDKLVLPTRLVSANVGQLW